MPVSLSDELQQREDLATKRLADLASAYTTFVQAWNDIEAEEMDALEALHDYIDKSKLADILHTITHIKE